MSDPELSKEDLEIIQTERDEWLDSLDYVIKNGGPERVKRLLRLLQNRAAEFGIHLPYAANTPYINTIARGEQPRFPGNHELEWRIRSLIRWNAMAMVVRANRESDGIGGHISTYGSAATLYEVAYNHFFHGKDHEDGGDLIYFQGHAAPGIYARAFLEGRLSEQQLQNFRRENKPGGGLSSYPHPYLMPDFWQFPTVSMGLGPIMSIYQARFNRYLEDRGLKEKTGRVWAFLGDGETDEPESLGAITLAAREKLDNLVFVINCNLQRLDGPVRGNYKIIQELEAIFRGAGWNVIKVIWGAQWDPLLEHDDSGLLVDRMDEVVDGEYQKYSAAGAKYIREHFFGKHPQLQKMVENMSDSDIEKLNRGGHDPEKVYAAYQAAMEHEGAPTVILAKTIKGYGLGEAGEGRNVTHQQKKLNEDELRAFRQRFAIPIEDEHVGEAPLYRPDDDSREMKYLREQREKLGGPVPYRADRAEAHPEPDPEIFSEFTDGSDGREASTTMVVVRLLGKLLRDKSFGKYVVPIIPDEARTFGMESLFRQVGIYSHVGQRYEPVDRDTLLYYREAQDGQILEEGITEAGSISSFIAAGTAYASHGVNMIPFFLFYSMFGFQRIGDLIWAAGDMGCRGFLIGGTAGRTTLAGEGLQHQDGHSHILASPYPHVITYDPAFAYEIAVIIQSGMKHMFTEQKNVIYYLTVGNENYEMPPVPEPGLEKLREPILKGMYLFRKSEKGDASARVQLLGSGSLMQETLEGAKMLEEKYGIAADVWSVTSYNRLFADALETERTNHLNGTDEKAYVETCIGEAGDAVVAVSDYVKLQGYSLARWLKAPLTALGTDGFGRSESRESLRDWFEVDRRYVVSAVLFTLARAGKFDQSKAKAAVQELGIDASKSSPMTTHWS